MIPYDNFFSYSDIGIDRRSALSLHLYRYLGHDWVTPLAFSS